MSTTAAKRDTVASNLEWGHFPGFPGADAGCEETRLRPPRAAGRAPTREDETRGRNKREKQRVRGVTPRLSPVGLNSPSFTNAHVPSAPFLPRLGSSVPLSIVRGLACSCARLSETRFSSSREIFWFVTASASRRSAAASWWDAASAHSRVVNCGGALRGRACGFVRGGSTAAGGERSQPSKEGGKTLVGGAPGSGGPTR